MNREEQIVKEAKTRSNIHINRIDGFIDESWDNGYRQGYENGFISGALWTDNNPRTDNKLKDNRIYKKKLNINIMNLYEKFWTLIGGLYSVICVLTFLIYLACKKDGNVVTIGMEWCFIFLPVLLYLIWQFVYNYCKFDEKNKE